MNTTLDGLIHADKELFLWLNGHHNAFWDVIMAVITYKFTWIPLYVLLLYSLVARFKVKAIGFLLCIIAVVVLSDQIASGIFKPYFMRLRPCYDPVIGPLVHVLNGCGGRFGFISSHAATGFGIAASFNLIPATRTGLAPLLYGWALIYSYSRIYVGVHYPLDVVVGGLVGVLVALMLGMIYQIVTRQFPSASV